MIRRQVAPRADWRARVEAQGLLFHSLGDVAYWGEGTCYALTLEECRAIEAATDTLQALCLEAAAHVIATQRYDALSIPRLLIPEIERSWEAEPPSLYGRMDLALDANGTPKLLEYNADTPTSLLEAAVIQWTWLQDLCPQADQFNWIHEQLLATWGDVRSAFATPTVHFASVDEDHSQEDAMTVGYLRDTAEQAGLTTVGLKLGDIGWDARGRRFIDRTGAPLRQLFKLYPWEGLAQDRFGRFLTETDATAWLEPAWKLLLSSKGILAILWELFPEHPNLLPAAFAPFAAPGGLVRKALLGREGSNVSIEAPGVRVTTDGPYAATGALYQAYVSLGEFDGFRPVLGSWVVGGKACGLGIRETKGYVTDNTARFVPHLVA